MTNKTLTQEGIDQIAHAAIAGMIVLLQLMSGTGILMASIFAMSFMYMREYYQNDRQFLLGPGSIIDLTGSLVGVVIVVVGKVIIA